MARMGEVIPSWNGHGVFTGREPHTSQRNQMKIFKTLAATAAVVTCCIGNPLPAQAQSISAGAAAAIAALETPWLGQPRSHCYMKVGSYVGYGCFVQGVNEYGQYLMACCN